jgi:hypothetical protein
MTRYLKYLLDFRNFAEYQKDKSYVALRHDRLAPPTSPNNQAVAELVRTPLLQVHVANLTLVYVPQIKKEIEEREERKVACPLSYDALKHHIQLW